MERFGTRTKNMKKPELTETPETDYIDFAMHQTEAQYTNTLHWGQIITYAERKAFTQEHSDEE